MAERAGAPVGFCGTHAVVDEEAAGLPLHSAELHWIHLRPECVGAGVGRSLMAHAVDDLAARGFRHSVLWVLEGNARARRFYAAGDWVPEGAKRGRSFRVDDIETTVVELRYGRTLSRPAPSA